MKEKLIEELLLYAQLNLGLGGYDVIYARNIIMALLKITEHYSEKLSDEEKQNIKKLDVPDILIQKLCDTARTENLAEEGMELSFASFIMSVLSPSPQCLADGFCRIKAEKGSEAACKYLLDISVKNNYIQKTAIEKNIIWQADFDENYIEITINLSKPEKDNKEILKQLKKPSSSYPKCMLCLENLGFMGNLNKPPRQNLRFVPVKLCGENWFMQYSPYMYYNEHCIVISENHTPMKVDKNTIIKLVDFAEQYPQYFIGSNASLPIVGGSILSHEHFQGGGHKMPLHFATDRKFYDTDINDVKISTVNWYNSVIRITSKKSDSVYIAACRVFDAWNNYNNEECGIIAQTTQHHNAFTPIVRKENGYYILEIILRNNRTSEQFPDGIFHAHPEHHNIKKEGIGLIEAMGLFILPARLKTQTEEIKKILMGEREYAEDLAVHEQMINKLKARQDGFLSPKEADSAITEYINETCKNILINTAVFKPDNKGLKAFDRFMQII